MEIETQDPSMTSALRAKLDRFLQRWLDALWSAGTSGWCLLN